MEGELYNAQEGLEGELGYKGERGYSTYELAVLNGFEGSLQDYLDHYGVDLSNYVSTSDVVDNLTSTTTNYPLSANQGKILKDTVDTKANANNVYTQEEVNTMLENINGKVLWVNEHMTSQFEAQTVELDLDDYDEVEIFFILNGYRTIDSCKLIKYKFGTYTWKTQTLWNGAMGVNIDYNTSTNNSVIAAEGRNVEWVDNGIKFGAGYSITHGINTSSGSSSAWGRTAAIDCHPAFIVGRKRNIYDLTTFSQE